MKTAAAFLALLPCMTFAQSMETDAGEVSVYTGGVFGAGSHSAVGAAFATVFSKYVLALVDISYLPLADQLLEPEKARGYASVARSRLYDFSGGVQVRVPARDRLAPYVSLGGGLLYSTHDLVAAGGGVTSGTENNFAFHTGAGARYYITDRFGIRPDLKVYVSKRNLTRFTIGVFYQFP